jgi:hypothetical protein
MPFALQYKPLIESESKVSKTMALPRNIYRIISYKYSDGTQKTLAGTKESLVFLIGIHDKKFTCIKISELKPDKFFRWLKPLFIKGLTEEQWQKSEKLEELIIMADKPGNKIFNQFVKTHPIYNQTPPIYRTYNLSGIKQIEMVNINKEVLKSYYK